jgi:hypothetical protein
MGGKVLVPIQHAIKHLIAAQVGGGHLRCDNDSSGENGRQRSSTSDQRRG